MRMFAKLFIMLLAFAAVGCCKNDGADFAKDIPAGERPAMQEIFLMVLFFVVQTVLEVQKLRGKDVSNIEEALNK